MNTLSPQDALVWEALTQDSGLKTGLHQQDIKFESQGPHCGANELKELQMHRLNRHFLNLVHFDA